jgi:signal transduction histidine kinase/ActR/RegA family two-component response regulator
MRTIHNEQDGSGSAGDDRSDGASAAGNDGAGAALAGRIAELEKQLAEERRARAVAESANRAKDEFLSVVSHELRSPLNAILGWNRILAIKRGQDAEVAAVTPRIEQSARAQLKMVNDLLDFGRIGTGKLRIALRPVKLSLLAGMAVEAMQPAAEAKGITLTIEPGAGGTIVGDPDRLMQVMSNLLSNATKFTPRGGRIAVWIREVGPNVELSVVDTGQGIAADLLPHVFDRFTQGDSSTTRNASGLGLGLTLAREIITLHSGTITASSPGVNRGSTFKVTLPAANISRVTREQDGAAARVDTTPRQLAGLSILVVDDEADARAVVAETLRLEGATVTVGDCVGAALAHLVEPDRHFDVLVTDIGMPDEDGYSLVRKLRKLSVGESLVAIALTGYASQADVEQAIDAGFDLHVPKPVDFDSFVPIIRRLARH